MSSSFQKSGYGDVTETPGVMVSRQALSMNFTRYRLAASLSKGKDVLEVACGAGQGLGYLANKARSVVGSDIDLKLLQLAGRHYKDRINLACSDAQSLPFMDRSFDVVLLFEAIYYIRDPAAFLHECRRVLRPGGNVAICTVNREWADFNPSPLSFRYFSGNELCELMHDCKFEVELLGAFSVESASLRDRVVSMLKRSAVRLGLIPKTMKGKELLKRAFLGKLVSQPPELYEGIAGAETTHRLDLGRKIDNFKVLYAIGRVT